MTSLVRLIPQTIGEPVVCVKEAADAQVHYLFWPRNEAYPRARAEADRYLAHCLDRAVEAPRPEHHA